MTTRYRDEHYEGVAKLLHGYRPLTKAPVRVIAEAFAIRFAADNPPTCTQPNVNHSNHICLKEGGFDREQFLAACGLEEEVEADESG